MTLNYSKSWSSLPDGSSGTLKVPKSLQKECLVRTREEDPEVLKQRQAAVKDNTVKELASISGLSDIPIPNPFKKKEKRSASAARYCCCNCYCCCCCRS